MIHPVLQLVLLALAFVLLLRLVSARWLRAVLAVLFALLLTTEAVCLYLTGSFFNYQVYVHANFEAVRGLGSLLIKQGAAAILTCAAVAFVPWEETQNGTPTRVILGQKYLPFEANTRGVNLLSRNTGGDYHIENFDWFDDPAIARKLLARMRALQQCRQPFVLIGDDAILRHPAELDEEFVRMGLYKLVPINGRAAYLAYSSAQGIVTDERTAPDTVSFDLEELPLPAAPCLTSPQTPAR